MPTSDNLQDIINLIRENRSNESNFEILHQGLQQAITIAGQQNNTTLLNNLKEVEEKYAAEYLKAKETRNSAWPEFENFVTQFERSINN